tara:strand:+ start:23368 stop:24831 length:1464 start_codon:yes stop_codon:yes gene_type:complete
MIKLSFSQKVRIIDHLSLPENWSNIFNAAFFSDETRKWAHKNVDGLAIMSSPDKSKYKVLDEENGRSLMISNQGGRIKVTDEHNRSFILSQGKVKSRGDTVKDVSPIQSTAEFGFTDDTAKPAILDNLNIVVRFNQNGSKAVFFEDIGHRVDMTAHGEGMTPESHPGRFFHKISLTENAMKEWDIHPAYAMMFAKLVIAKDLNIEPSLDAFNELDEDMAQKLLFKYLEDKYDETWDGPEAWRPKVEKKNIGITEAEKPWNDTTEFGGYYTAIPNRFFIQKVDDGYDLTTSSDAKHSIWSQGELLRQARSEQVTSIQTINDRTATSSVLHMLNNGNTTTDHLGRDWKFVVLQSAASQKVVTNMNDVAHNALGITSHDYAAINFDDTHSLLAIEAETLERVTISHSASTEVMRMIEKNDTDQDRLYELISMGADYRYIDPDAASKGKTFANFMKESERYELLTMLRDTQGIAPDMPDIDDLGDDNTLHL